MARPTQITIPAGATLSGLARQHKTTTQALMAANPQIRDPNVIRAGAKLTIPTPPPAPARTPPAPARTPPAPARTPPAPARTPPAPAIAPGRELAWTMPGAPVAPVITPPAPARVVPPRTYPHDFIGPLRPQDIREPAPGAYAGPSIVDYLKSVGQPSDFASRVALARQHGIVNYTGTGPQNTQLLNLLRTGVAPRVEAGVGVTPGARVVPEAPLIVTRDEAIAEDEAVKRAEEEAELQKQLRDDREIQRLTAQQQLQDLRTQLGLDPRTGAERPAIPTFVGDFEALRAEHGIEALETQINALNTEIRNTEASLRLGVQEKEGRLAPMELIGERQLELRRQGQEQLDVLNRRRQTLIEEHNTKANLVNNIMDLKRMDYTTARDAYDRGFNQQIQLLNIIEGRETRAQQEVNRLRDDARANLNLIANIAKDKTWDELDPGLQSQIQVLEIKGGIPSGTYQAFMGQKPEVEVLSTTTGVDAQGNQIVTFIYKDKDGLPGIVRTIRTGAVKEPGKKEARADDWARAEQFIRDNPDATYEQLYSGIIDGTELKPSEIETVLKHAGKTPTPTPPATEKYMKDITTWAVDVRKAGWKKTDAINQWKINNKADVVPEPIMKIFDEVFGVGILDFGGHWRNIQRSLGLR